MSGMNIPAALLTVATLLAGCQGGQSPRTISSLAGNDSVAIFDHHVHVMSPTLVERWKSIAVPFSKPDYAYSDIDSILKFNPADRMFLISMAYIYASPEFSDSAERSNVARENEFVAGLARTHPEKLYAFCGVNPLRDYAAAELLRCRNDLGVYGLKLHFASSAVSLKDPVHLARVREILSLAADEKMPVVLHFDNQTDTFDAGDVALLIDSVLATGPAMELYLAHLGTSGGYTHVTRILLERFSGALKNLPALAKHRIFFDISTVGLTEGPEQVPPLTPQDFADLSGQLTELGLDRVVFGTDYPAFNSTAYLSVLESKMTWTGEELLGIAGNGIPARGKAR